VSEDPPYLENGEAFSFDFAEDEYGVAQFEKKHQELIRNTQMNLYLKAYSEFSGPSQLQQVLSHHL